MFQQFDGVCQYSVHDYTNRGSSNSRALSDSGAQVVLISGDKVIKTYNVPNSPGTLWTVFQLEGNVVKQIN
jgi:hypothetical protein